MPPRSRIFLRAAPLVVVGSLLVGCGGGASSRTAADPAPKPERSAHAVRLPGAPDGLAISADRSSAFVALQSGRPRVAIVALRHGERLPRTVAVPTYASGMKLTPDGRFVLAAAGRGLLVLDARAAIRGRGRILAGQLAAPAAVSGDGPGAAEVAVTPDSRYAFVTLEGAGRIAVFDLRALLAGHRGSAFRGSIGVGAGALGLTVSPDGRWLYEVSESQGLRAISVGAAVADPRTAPVHSTEVKGAPVRVAVSPDGRAVWVTARASHRLLGFSAADVVAGDARPVSITAVGPGPLGLAVMPNGSRVLVANSGLSSPRAEQPGVSVVATPASGPPRQLSTVRVSGQPDALAALSNSSVLLTDSRGRRLIQLWVGRG